MAAFGHKERLPAGAAKEKGPIFDIGHIELKAVDLSLHFRSWQADIYNLRTDKGTLRVSFREQLIDDIDFNFSTIPLVGDRGKLTIGPLSFDLKNIQVSRFGIFPDSHTQMDYDLVADTAEGARLHARGALLSLWKRPGGVDLTLEVERA